jgi:hypothetical protein
MVRSPLALTAGGLVSAAPMVSAATSRAHTCSARWAVRQHANLQKEIAAQTSMVGSGLVCPWLAVLFVFGLPCLAHSRLSLTADHPAVEDVQQSLS